MHAANHYDSSGVDHFHEHPQDPAAADLAPVEFLSHMAASLTAGTVDLPAFPQVVINVQESLKDPNYTPQTIARAISVEKSLADRLLQMANSTAFNATGRVIIDLGVAVTRLGAQKVHSVALAHAIQHIRGSESLRSIARPLDELWAESVMVAYFSEAIAKRTSFPAPDAFVAGLLHGIGRLYILAQCVRQPPSRPPIIVSAALVDAWHPAIGKAVLQNWQMSTAVCDAVGAQGEAHAVRRSSPALVDVLVTSMRMARRLRDRYDSSSLTAGGALARLNLSLETCQGLITDASVEIGALQRALRA
jgi:HD-like signal output (HDOD) protein